MTARPHSAASNLVGQIANSPLASTIPVVLDKADICNLPSAPCVESEMSAFIHKKQVTTEHVIRETDQATYPLPNLILHLEISVSSSVKRGFEPLEK